MLLAVVVELQQLPLVPDAVVEITRKITRTQKLFEGCCCCCCCCLFVIVKMSLAESLSIVILRRDRCVYRETTADSSANPGRW